MTSIGVWCRYMDAMELGVLTEMPDIRKKARRKLFKQQVIIEIAFLSFWLFGFNLNCP